jgi:hypothetical protein
VRLTWCVDVPVLFEAGGSTLSQRTIASWSGKMCPHRFWRWVTSRNSDQIGHGLEFSVGVARKLPRDALCRRTQKASRFAVVKVSTKCAGRESRRRSIDTTEIGGIVEPESIGDLRDG